MANVIGTFVVIHFDYSLNESPGNTLHPVRERYTGVQNLETEKDRETERARLFWIHSPSNTFSYSTHLLHFASFITFSYLDKTKLLHLFLSLSSLCCFELCVLVNRNLYSACMHCTFHFCNI